MHCLITILLACTLAACAPAWHTFSVPRTSQSAPSPSVPANPPTTAEQALRTMLRMIDSVHGPEDMTPEKFMQVTGVPLRYAPDGGNPNYKWDQQVAKNWWVDFSFSWQRNGSTRGEDAIADLHFAQWPSVSVQEFPMTDVCQMDWQQFDAELKKIGFVHVRHLSQAGAHIHRYKRGMAYLHVSYAGESNQNVTHDCVRSVSLELINQ